MKKKINLYESFKLLQTKKKAAGSGLVMFSIILIIGLIIGAIGIRLNLEKNSLSTQVTSLENNVSSAKASQNYLDLQKNQEQIDAINNTITILQEGKEILNQKKSIDMEAIEKFYAIIPDKVEILEANILLPMVTLTLSYTNQKDLHKYLTELDEMSEVNSVSSKTINSKEGILNTMVLITMKGSY